MTDRTEIKDYIPHREPFLLLDNIIESNAESLKAEFTVDQESPLFAQIFPGHYPGNPITPGVILCEIVFQAGAVLMSKKLMTESENLHGSPVVTRIRDCRFKQMVKPGDRLEIAVEIEDMISNAYYLKGSITVDGKPAVRVSFTCALV